MNRQTIASCIHTLLIVISLGAAIRFFHEQKQSERVAAQFRTAVLGAGAGQWFWDIDQNVLRWDDRMFDLFHCGTDGWENVEGVWEWRGTAADAPAAKFSDCLVDEDKPMVMAALQRSIMMQGSYQAIFRVTGDDGEIYTIRAGGAVYGGGRYMTGLCLRSIRVEKPGELDVSVVELGPAPLEI